MIDKPRIIEVINNCTFDTGLPVGIKEVGLLYGGNRFLEVGDDGLTVYLINADTMEKTDDSPCIMQIHLPFIWNPEKVVDLEKVAEMSALEFFDYISSLEDSRIN